MGAKQSSLSANPAATGRTRAYSGSDLPSITSSSNGSNVSRTTAGGARHPVYSASGPSSSSGQPHGARARSVGGSRPQSGIDIPNSSEAYSSQESGGSSPEEADRERPGGRHEGGRDGPRLVIGSLPAHLSPHLFGEDVLSKDAGECAICLEELVQGDTIGRLPCLCIYHKGCIDEWFEVNRSCPEHPSD
ncbi:E3 ubiquitin-protein ligase znrf2 isoform 2-T2 [Spinachia spinachia]